MFDKLEDLLIRFEEIMGELQEPDVVNDQARFRSLMKEQNDLVPIVEAYKEYKTCNADHRRQSGPCWKMKAMRKCGSF